MIKLARFALISASTLTLALLIPTKLVFAERQEPLVQFPLRENATCRILTSDRRGLSSSISQRGDYEPVIGRQLYQSSYRIRAGEGMYTALVCEVDTEDFDTLTLRLGISDNATVNGDKMTINIYQSGTVISTYSEVQGGRIIDTAIDLSEPQYPNPGDIGVELLCENSGRLNGCFLWFIEEELSPTGNYISSREPGRRPQEGGRDSQGSSETRRSGGSDRDSSRRESGGVGDLIQSVEDLINIFR